MGFWQHLFDNIGFPQSRLTYGHGWTPILLALVVLGQGFGAFGCLILVVTFLLGIRAWRTDSFDFAPLTIHAPRVVIVYLISTVFLGLMLGSECYAIRYSWWRLVGVTTFAAGISILAAGWKTFFAYRCCLRKEASRKDPANECADPGRD